MREIDDSNIQIREEIYVPPAPDWYFPTHEHAESLEFSFVLKGRGTLYIDNNQLPLHPGSLAVKNAGVKHAERSAAEDPLEQICIGISGILTDSKPNHLLPDYMDPVLSPVEEQDYLNECFRFLLGHIGKTAYKKACLSVVSSIIGIILAEIDSAAPAAVRKRQASELVSAVRNYIDRHYSEQLKLSGLAELYFVSEGHLSRQFRLHTGYTVSQYLLDRRMGEAQRLLVFEDYTIKEISSICGYPDIHYFYQVFRKYAGCTPAEFRVKYRNQSVFPEYSGS